MGERAFKPCPFKAASCACPQGKGWVVMAGTPMREQEHRGFRRSHRARGASRLKPLLQHRGRCPTASHECAQPPLHKSSLVRSRSPSMARQKFLQALPEGSACVPERFGTNHPWCGPARHPWLARNSCARCRRAACKRRNFYQCTPRMRDANATCSAVGSASERPFMPFAACESGNRRNAVFMTISYTRGASA